MMLRGRKSNVAVLIHELFITVPNYGMFHVGYSNWHSLFVVNTTVTKMNSRLPKKCWKNKLSVDVVNTNTK